MDSYRPSLADLEARLAKLERQNRRWKRLGLLFLLIAGSGLLLAQAPRKAPSAAPTQAVQAATYDTLVVHRLELRDQVGKLRGLWTGEGETPGLKLLDTAGEIRAFLNVGAKGPVLALLDAAGKPRAGLAVMTENSGLTLLDTAGKPRAGLSLSTEGPGLSLYDAAGKRRAALGVREAGEGREISTAAVMLFGKDGKVIWRAP